MPGVRLDVRCLRPSYPELIYRPQPRQAGVPAKTAGKALALNGETLPCSDNRTMNTQNRREDASGNPRFQRSLRLIFPVILFIHADSL
jgi:hypothetical protein